MPYLKSEYGGVAMSMFKKSETYSYHWEEIECENGSLFWKLLSIKQKEIFIVEKKRRKKIAETAEIIGADADLGEEYFGDNEAGEEGEAGRCNEEAV